jgi:hypothetical protein
MSESVRQYIVLGLGVLMIMLGLLGTILTFTPVSESADGYDRSDLQEQMRDTMDMMMGAGSSERMHATMPGSEEMMESCTGTMGGRMNMMQGMDHMMDGRTH